MLAFFNYINKSVYSVLFFATSFSFGERKLECVHTKRLNSLIFCFLLRLGEIKKEIKCNAYSIEIEHTVCNVLASK